MPTNFIPNTDIEIINSAIDRGHIQNALFDFDGTISLIREGWQTIMINMMVDILIQTPDHENETALYAVVSQFITRLTGEQTIYQMIQLCKEIEIRGGKPENPLTYKHQYHNLLLTNIEHRLEGLRSKNLLPTTMMVNGALEFLQSLQEKRVCCYLASGTDEIFVQDEAKLLEIDPFFSGIFGAKDDYIESTKRKVIQRILTDKGINGADLISFGDGYVEIEDTKRVGGIAVGVATNEDTGVGINEWKRSRLIEAGADLIIPNFCHYQILMNYLL